MIRFMSRLICLLFAASILNYPTHGQVLTVDSGITEGKVSKSDSENPRTITCTLSGGAFPNSTEVELVLQLESGQTIRFGSPVRTSNPAQERLEFSGKFSSSLPEHFSGLARFVLRYADKASTINLEAEQFRIRIDLVPPRIIAVRAVGDEFGARLLEFTLEEENLKEKYDHRHFTIKSIASDTDVHTKTDNNPPTYSVENRMIRVPITPTAGLISISVGSFGTNSATKFTDALGNELEPFSTTIAATGQRPAGTAVDFPPNVIPRDAGRHSDSNLIRPSSRVVTRVVKLYYYRDAHRVAEIINRRTQQWNLANVQAKRGLATQAAENADEVIAQRRQAEREAVDAAKRTREKERELAQQQTTAEEAQRLAQNISTYPDNSYVVTAGDGRLVVVPAVQIPVGDREQLMTVEKFKEQLGEQVTRFNNLRREVDELKRTEESLNNRARGLEDKESRLVRTQFLRELDASLEDPNTYAPAHIDSVDPVMQTSVSVIGEGTIQLRGPIDGINQIRRMIHQIDTPVGQVKVDLETVQLNGEKGQELEQSVQLVEGYINVGRFLTNQSLVMLTRSVSEVAAEVAQEFGEPWQRDQMGRDMRYLYGYFGVDFIDTLYRMDSEFLHTENQILSLHSMDSISRNRCLLLIGLAKNSVRQRILDRFQQYIQGTLPTLEYQYRMANQAIPCQYLPSCQEECKQKVHSVLHPRRVECPRYCLELAIYDAQQNYLFLNFHNFFTQGDWHDATLNPMQREFIRLAQIFKSQMISEIELKQRIVERGLMDQKLSEDSQQDQSRLKQIRLSAVNDRADVLDDNRKALQGVGEALSNVIVAVADAANALDIAIGNLKASRQELSRSHDNYDKTYAALESLRKSRNEIEELQLVLISSVDVLKAFQRLRSSAGFEVLQKLPDVITSDNVKGVASALNAVFNQADNIRAQEEDLVSNVVKANTESARQIKEAYQAVIIQAQKTEVNWEVLVETMARIRPLIPAAATAWQRAHESANDQLMKVVVGTIKVNSNTMFLDQNRLPLEQLKLLDHLIDEHQEKAMDLLEGTRAHISAIDNFLKRMTFAMEDDFQVQFYDPALVCLRTAARGRRVTFSQVERTTVLGNNRELLKVLPQATMEFDLPNRQLRITEAMQGAKALVDDYGALLKDPTFLAAFQMMGGNVPADSVRNVLPGLSTERTQAFHALPSGPNNNQLGSSLQSLVPDPEIYKFETGTGFEVRPVIQPDGDSLVYDLTYLYTTEIREPVRADEKHLGRVKRHLLHTQVQTSSFELREVGRYQVALKAVRTARGVPMLENAPVVGALFRPAPSEESSIQQNILLAKSVVYPTLYDLMGLAWAQHVAELNYDEIRNSGHVARGRQRVIRQHVFDHSSENVDNFLQITPGKDQYRPDLYREHSVPSPYHPNGYIYPKVTDDQDPSRRGFRIPDRRPEAFKMGTEEIPAEEYDSRFRLPQVPADHIYLDHPN